MGHVDTLSRSHRPHPSPADNPDRTDQATEEAESTVNAICRAVASVDVDDASFRIQATQSRDVDICTIREKLEQGPVEGFLLADGLVFRDNPNERPQMLVAVELQDNIIRTIHEKIGHLSVEKTVQKIRDCYWFTDMREKVTVFIRNCVKCIMYAAPVRACERELHSIPKQPTPFDTIHLDHFGPLPSLNSKRKHMLVVIDAFTKHVKLYPVNSTSTREVLACLEKYISYYCRPRRVITDQGTCFTSL